MRFRRCLGFCWQLARQAGSSLLERIQGIKAYRLVARHVWPRVEILEASVQEMAPIYNSLMPKGREAVYAPNPLVTHFAAKRGGRVVGFVQLIRDPDENSPFAGHWLFSLFVWPRYRGMGIGEKLSQRVLAQAAKEGANRLFLLVNEDNGIAVKLYRKLRFETVIVPAMEDALREERALGRKRIVMCRTLEDLQS